MERLGDGDAPLDGATAGHVRSLFLAAIDRPDFHGSEPGAPGISPAELCIMRGLAARGLIRLYGRTRDDSLPDVIEELSADEAGSVRCAVAEELELLFDANPALAGRITSGYALDTDDNVLFTISYPLLRLAKTDEGAAIGAIEKLLLPHRAASDAAYSAIRPLLFLALAGRNPNARAILDGVLADTGSSEDARLTAMHTLGRYLSGPSTRDGALDDFSLLLDSEYLKTRTEAAYCLIFSIDRHAGGPAPLLEKIQVHLDKMSRGVRGDDGDHRILETLTDFLRKYWHLMPRRALGHLEQVAALPESPYQPYVMMDAVETLNGLFRELPGEDDRRRCLSVLDRFAMAGWPPALDLLRKMERPD